METTKNFNATEAAAYLGFARNTLYFHIRKDRIRQEPDGSFSKAELDRYKTRTGNVTADNVVTDEENKMLLKIVVAQNTAIMTLLRQLYDFDLIDKE